jgi:hypothetical protein
MAKIPLQKYICLFQLSTAILSITKQSGSLKEAILPLFIFLCIYCKKYIFAPD